MKLLPSFYGIVLLITLTGVISCNGKQSSSEEKKGPLSDTAKFYPIEKFIQDEIEYVDLRDFNITETKLNDSGDTAFAKEDHTYRQLTKDEFISAAKEIKNTALWFSKNKYLYKETVFQDLGTESYTINYQSENADIKNIDLLLNEQTNLPKRLFIREITREEENIITIQYSWIAGKQFTISKSMKNGKTLIWQSSKTIEWNNKP